VKVSHRQQVIQKLCRLVSNLEEIRERKVIVNSEWKNIDNEVNEIYSYFLEMLNHYIDACNYLMNIIPKIPKAYWSKDTWDELVDYQSLKAHYFRMFSLRFFPPPTIERLYNYLFIKDLLRTFPKALNLQKDIKFLVTHSNSIALFSIEDALTGLVGSINTAIRSISDLVNDDIDSLHSENAIMETRHFEAYAFECDPREKLSNKIILGHEIFHMLVKKNPLIENKFSQGLSKGIFDEYFSDVEQTGFDRNKINEISHIEELFCDFGAAWHLGPCSGFAALNELAFFGKASSSSHPPRAARIKIILNAYTNIKHPSVDRYKLLIDVYQNEMKTINNSSIKTISDFFSTILKNDLKIMKCRPSNEEEKLKKHIQNKIPFMYDRDIRILFNNLPPSEELSRTEKKGMNEYLFESIRKNLMRLEFGTAMEKKMSQKIKIELPEVLNV